MSQREEGGDGVVCPAGSLVVCPVAPLFLRPCLFSTLSTIFVSTTSIHSPPPTTKYPLLSSPHPPPLQNPSPAPDPDPFLTQSPAHDGRGSQSTYNLLRRFALTANAHPAYIHLSQQCPVCNSTFTRPQHVARHMRSREYTTLPAHIPRIQVGTRCKGVRRVVAASSVRHSSIHAARAQSHRLSPGFSSGTTWARNLGHVLTTYLHGQIRATDHTNASTAVTSSHEGKSSPHNVCIFLE